MSLTYTQRRLLAMRGVIVVIERGDGICKCLTADGERYYTATDLARMAQPSAVERVRAWIIGRAAA